MIFSNKFDDGKTIELFSHSFELTTNSAISLKIKGPFEHYFIVVKDPNGVQRALFTYKTRQKEYFITDDPLTMSNGSIAGPMTLGTWNLTVVKTYEVHGSYLLEVDTTDHKELNHLDSKVLEEDWSKVYNTQSRYYIGDLHMHSDFSDGRVTLHQVYNETKRVGMDYLAMTDHSTVTTLQPDSLLPNIPATEITWDNLGHYNIYGLKKLIDYTEYLDVNQSKSSALNRMFKSMREEGKLISINHPFAEGIDLQHAINMEYITHLEIINAPHLLDVESDNNKALRFYDFLWNCGYKLIGIGGSDAHKENYYERYPVGLPNNKIYCEGLSIENLLSGLEKGHVIVQSGVDFEVIYTDSKKANVLPGTRLLGTMNIQARSKEKVTWKLVKNGVVINEVFGSSYLNQVDIAHNEYVRLEAWNEDDFALFVNPVHSMDMVIENYDFLELVKEFEKKDSIKF